LVFFLSAEDRLSGDNGHLDSALPVVGLLEERQALVNSIRHNESLLLLGPGGSGKTALVRSALASELRGESLVHVAEFDTLHDLLVTIARGLLKSGHKRLRQSVKSPGDWELWLARQTSIHLKGLLWTALEQEPTPIILDGIQGAGHQTHRFFQRLYFVRGMTIVATARDHQHLGELTRLFWDPWRTRYMQPLSEAEGHQLFEAAVDHFRLRELCLDDFREKVLDSARGNPGQIVEMCRFASNPMYVTGSHHIKFAPLRIDVMMRFLPAPSGYRAR
jgi:NB-ARC domain